MSSIHAAKGLEFSSVAVVGLHEGGLPDFRSVNPAQLAEERRLLYVAITRARNSLLLTSSQQRTSKAGKKYDIRPSSLLQAAGLKPRK